MADIFTDDMLNVKTVDEAIQKMAGDPGKLGKIVDSVRDNPEMFNTLLAQTNKTPGVADKLMAAVMANPEMKKEAMTMSSQKKAEMIANMKASNAANREAMIDCVKIRQNGVPKKYKMGREFPSGTIFDGGDVYSIDPDITVFTTKKSQEENGIATKMIGIDGVKVYGEIIMVRECPNTGKYITLKFEDGRAMREAVTKKR
jgi:hypothetical protein